MTYGCFQVPEAHGRYLVSHTSTISTRTLSDTLSKRFPQYRFPEGTDEPAKEVVDNSKVATYGHLEAVLPVVSPHLTAVHTRPGRPAHRVTLSHACSELAGLSCDSDSEMLACIKELHVAMVELRS